MKTFVSVTAAALLIAGLSIAPASAKKRHRHMQSTITRGFASLADPHVAVCLRPGTEIAFENDVQVEGIVFRRNVRDRLARFRQIDMDRSACHHDALEFSNGEIVLVTDLKVGQRATVLQLPASPVIEKPQMPEPAPRHEVAGTI